MMNTIQKKIVLTSILVVSLASLFGIVQPQIFADETDEKQYTNANDVTIHTVFTFRGMVEESDGFQVYNQITGFAVSKKPSFKLEGVVNYDRAYLYEAADDTFGKIALPSQKYGQFDVDVYLQNKDITLRHFSYVNCNVSKYEVETLFDKEEGWNSNKGFAIIDKFEFECNGYKPNNPVYDLMITNGYDVADTVSSLDLAK